MGAHLLDLGAGEGYVAAALEAEARCWACSVDVGAFGVAPGAYVVYDGRRLPFADRAFDTTLLLLTLHHCADAEAVLDEAIRVTRTRILVMESVFRNRVDRFWLDLLDGRLNARRHGGRMNVPLGFRSPEAWASLFVSRGLRIAATQWPGSRWERLVHHPLLFVLDRPFEL